LAGRQDAEVRMVQEAAATFEEERDRRASSGPSPAKASISAMQTLNNQDLFLWKGLLETGLPEEQRISRDLIQVYLVMILDHFFTAWRQEKSLSTGVADREPEASAKRIEMAGVDLAKSIPAMHLRFTIAAADTLAELRARRDLVVHHASQATGHYISLTHSPLNIGDVVHTDDAYLDRSVEFVENIVAAIAYKTSGQTLSTMQGNRVLLVFDP